MPIVQISLALQELEIGDHLSVLARDPAFLADIEAWSRMTGNVLVEVEGGVEQHVVVRKA